MLSRAMAAIRGYRYGLRSGSIGERVFEVDTPNGPASIQHSAFNVAWLSELGITPRCIVELGSYDGGDAYRFSHAFPDARIVTVEADPTRFAIVSANLAGQDIEILNYAACDTNGEIEWFSAEVDGETGAQGSIFRHAEDFRDKFPMVQQAETPGTVMGRRFDTLAEDLNLQEIDLLHMDIEGAEHTVLTTLGNLRPHLIYMEWREGAFIGRACGPETADLLARMGYVLILQRGIDRLYLHT